jgi:hypothetical protein
MSVKPVNDEELVGCLHKLVGGSCMMEKTFRHGCMGCPSQRDTPGCVLRIVKNQLKAKIISKHRDEISDNEERMGGAQEMIVELRAQNAKHQMEIERMESL